MISVLTGDLIKSRAQDDPISWLNKLKSSLGQLSPNNTYWEVYRGDGFQLEITDITKSLWSAIYLKACIKSIRDLDVRIAIGIGTKDFVGETVTESNGQAFQFSGDTLEQMKKEKVNLKLKSTNSRLDHDLNLYIKLGLMAMDNWTPSSAEVVALVLQHPEASQKEIGQQLGISQNTVSEHLKRAHFDEISALLEMYAAKIKTL